MLIFVVFSFGSSPTLLMQPHLLSMMLMGLFLHCCWLLSFYEMLENLSHVCYFLLNPIPLMLRIFKIIDCVILDHLGHHVCIVHGDSVFWGCYVWLHFLVRTPHLYDWPQILSLILLSSTQGGSLCCLSLFLMNLRCLCVVLFLGLGAFLGHPPFFCCALF
jgi:hypothetical protein